MPRYGSCPSAIEGLIGSTTVSSPTRAPASSVELVLADMALSDTALSRPAHCSKPSLLATRKLMWLGRCPAVLIQTVLASQSSGTTTRVRLLNTAAGSGAGSNRRINADRSAVDELTDGRAWAESSSVRGVERTGMVTSGPGPRLGRI